MNVNNYKDAQRAVLSIILNFGRDAMDICSKYLEEVYFTELRYKYIWRAMNWLFENDSEINDILVQQCMEVTKDSTGQVAFFLLDPRTGKHKEELQNIKNFKDKENISFLGGYIDLILDKYGVNGIITKLNEALDISKHGNVTVGQLQNKIGEMGKFFVQKDRKQPRNMSEIEDSMIEKINSSVDGDQTIIHTGIKALDEYVWLTQKNQTVIAGDTGMGKTSLALQIAWNVARQRKKLIDLDSGKPILDENGNEKLIYRRVCIFTLEMSEDELCAIFICKFHNIDMKTYQNKLTPKEKISLIEEFKKLRSIVAPNLFIDDTIETIKDVEHKVNQLSILEGGIDLIVADYLQLFADLKDNPMKENSQYRMISRFFKKNIATRKETHTIILSQLNEVIPGKDGIINHRPVLKRLFGSSAMKQDATHVIFVYREWAVDIKKTLISSTEQASSLYISRLILAKHRFGDNQVEIISGFIPYLTWFVPLDKIRKLGLFSIKDASNIKFEQLDEFKE